MDFIPTVISLKFFTECSLVPAMCQVSPFEFLQKWNSVPVRADNAAHCYALLLLQVDPPELPRSEACLNSHVNSVATYACSHCGRTDGSVSHVAGNHTAHCTLLRMFAVSPHTATFLVVAMVTVTLGTRSGDACST